MPMKKVLHIFFTVLGALIALILVGAAVLWILYPGEYLRGSAFMG